MATQTYNFQQIAAAFIVANNPAGVKKALVDNGLVADYVIANAMTPKQLTAKLYQYYANFGNAKYVALLRGISYNAAANNFTTDPTVITPASTDLANLNASLPASGIITTQSACTDWWCQLLGTIEGQTTSTTNPVITTTTKASPITIGLIIGGIAVLGIIAWVAVKYS